MLSYRHGFHAGNHADVLKHWVICLIAEYMAKKDKPYWYIDTHAAAGGYSLSDEKSEKTGEYKTGIEKIWKKDNPAALHEYLRLVKQFNKEGDLNHYPGSPWFARQLLREQDKARLFELHPSDFQLLSKLFQRDRQVKTDNEDGFAGLKALLPPTTKRAFVAIDPPYERPAEYKEVVKSIRQALQRFATGVYLIWYPLINRNQKQNASENMVKELLALNPGDTLDVRLWISGENESQGMYGSGLFIINPPWTLKQTLEQTLPYLVGMLGESDQAGFQLQVSGE